MTRIWKSMGVAGFHLYPEVSWDWPVTLDRADPQLSTIDGWWEEGFDGSNGWALPRVPQTLDIEETDREDAAALYKVLEQEIVPSYYDRDVRGVPMAWVERMRNALRVAASKFTAHRMVRDYAERYYTPAMQGALKDDDPPRS